MLVAIILFYFYWFSPFQRFNFFPACGFKSVTGLECVGCGGQRAIHELLHLNLAEAFRQNPFFVISIPLLMYYIFNSLRRYLYGIPTPNNFFYTWSFGRIFIIAILLFMIVRNLI